MGTGASIKENISFDQLEVTETLHDFLEDEKSKSRLLLIHLNCYIDCISKAGYLAVDYAMQNKPQVRNSVIAIFELRNHKRSIIELWKRIYLSILRVLELESITHRKILTRRQWKKPLKVKEKKKYVPRN